jgi:hypothetical protein
MERDFAVDAEIPFMPRISLLVDRRAGHNGDAVDAVAELEDGEPSPFGPEGRDEAEDALVRAGLQEDDAGPEEHDMFVVDPGVVACLLRQFEEGFGGKFVEGELLLHGSFEGAARRFSRGTAR